MKEETFYANRYTKLAARNVLRAAEAQVAAEAEARRVAEARIAEWEAQVRALRGV